MSISESQDEAVQLLVFRSSFLSFFFSLSFFFPSLSFKREFTPTARTENILMSLLVSGGRLQLFMRIATLQKCLFLEIN